MKILVLQKAKTKAISNTKIDPNIIVEFSRLYHVRRVEIKRTKGDNITSGKLIALISNKFVSGYNQTPAIFCTGNNFHQKQPTVTLILNETVASIFK